MSSTSPAAASASAASTSAALTVHQSEAGASASASLSFHAPTYSYYLDRSPGAYPLLLLYLRDGPACLRRHLLSSLDPDFTLFAALRTEGEFFCLPVLCAVVKSVHQSLEGDRLLGEEDRFWADVVRTIDTMFPPELAGVGQLSPRGGAAAAAAISNVDGLGLGHTTQRARTLSTAPATRPASPQLQLHSTALQRNLNLQRNLGSMLRRLAFSRDSMLRVCHATYKHSPEFEERLLEILHTNCTICKRLIFYPSSSKHAK
jgi:hypothetical protein